MSTADVNVANYQDPPPGKMGWGTFSQVRQSRAFEKTTIDRLFTSQPKLLAQSPVAQIPEQLETAIRRTFKFDAGWSFLEVERLVYGQNFSMNQNIGNCVGASHCELIGTRIAHEILADGDAEDPLGIGQLAKPYIPYSYGVGRLVGGMLGPGDGSYCGAQIEGSMKHGFLPCFTPGLTDPPQSSEQVGRQFGSSRSTLEKWMPYAKQFDLVEAPQCRSADDAIKLITERKIPLQICSGWGFAYSKYDPQYDIELYRPSGSWSHSMQVIACIQIKGAWFIVIRNQWGESHKGSPSRNIPRNCFVIPIETFDRWVKDSETLGIGQIAGLPSNPGA